MRLESDIVSEPGLTVEPGRTSGPGSISALTAGFRVFFCALVVLLGPMTWWQRHGWVVQHSLSPTSFLEHGGFSFQFALPDSLFTRRLTDSAGGELSDLRIFEGKKQLGPGHTAAGVIESHGGGAFNDWEGSVVLATPDGSDPRKNGRLYSVSYRTYPSTAAQVAYVVICALMGLLTAEAVCASRLRLWRHSSWWTGAQRRHAGLTVALYAAFALFVSLALHGLAIRATLSPDAMASFGGSAYSASLPTILAPMFTGSGDDASGGSWSNLTITEDGHRLGPAHSPHAQIRSEGLGAYSHWGNGIVFSATDGSDPRDNGRSYDVSYRVFLLPALAWGGLALCGCAVLIRFVRLRRILASDVMSRAAARPSIRGLAGGEPLLRPSSLLRFGGLVIVYTAALLLLYGSLVARQSDTGGFKINFEYKAF